MKTRHYLIVFVLITALILSACGPKPDLSAILPPDPSRTATLVPSATATFLPSPSHTLSPSPTSTPTATPEPVTFKIGRNDDMFSVALYFGVSLDALKTANPEVNPNAMRVGTELLIPITPTPVPTPTIAPANTPGSNEEEDSEGPEIYKTYCYRDAMLGVYCYSVIENDNDDALENVSLLVTLSDETGKTEQAIATTLINVIPPHTSVPAASYFLPEWGERLTASAELDFQLPYAEGEERYLEVELIGQTTELLLDNKAARINGEISFKNKNTAYMAIYVLSVAYDKDGAVLGMRRFSDIEGGLTSYNKPVSITVYSMAGEIARVDVFVEALAFPPEPAETPTP